MIPACIPRLRTEFRQEKKGECIDPKEDAHEQAQGFKEGPRSRCASDKRWRIHPQGGAENGGGLEIQEVQGGET
jgi:hypothetical protein